MRKRIDRPSEPDLFGPALAIVAECPPVGAPRVKARPPAAARRSEVAEPVFAVAVNSPGAETVQISRDLLEFFLKSAFELNQAVYIWTKHNESLAARDESQPARMLIPKNRAVYAAIRQVETSSGLSVASAKARKSKVPPEGGEVGYVYVLELEDGCWYVGFAKDWRERVAEHLRGNGSEWTKAHPVIRCVAWHEFDQVQQARQFEEFMTEKLVYEFGPQVVRGGRAAGVNREALGLEQLEAAFASMQVQMRK